MLYVISWFPRPRGGGKRKSCRCQRERRRRDGRNDRAFYGVRDGRRVRRIARGPRVAGGRRPDVLPLPQHVVQSYVRRQRGPLSRRPGAMTAVPAVSRQEIRAYVGRTPASCRTQQVLRRRPTCTSRLQAAPRRRTSSHVVRTAVLARDRTRYGLRSRLHVDRRRVPAMRTRRRVNRTAFHATRTRRPAMRFHSFVDRTSIIAHNRREKRRQLACYGCAGRVA